MVKRVSSWRQFSDRIPDLIWPHLTGDPEPEPKDHDYFSTENAGLLDEVNRVLSSRLAQAEARVRSVDSKLTALLTLSSVVSVAITASLAAATTLGTVGQDAKPFAWVAVVLVFYVALQLLGSLMATVAGLMRKSFKILSPEQITPEFSETSETYRVRLLNLQVNYMLWNEWVVNQKVSEMAVAHAALKNTLIATFALIVLALVIASVHLLS